MINDKCGITYNTTHTVREYYNFQVIGSRTILNENKFSALRFH